MQELTEKFGTKIGKILKLIPQYQEIWQRQAAHTRKWVKFLVIGGVLIVLVGGGKVGTALARQLA